MSLSKPSGLKTFSIRLLLPRHRLGRTGSVVIVTPGKPGIKWRMQGSTTSSIWRPWVRPQGYSKIDQGRSLLAFAHEDELRRLVKWCPLFYGGGHLTGISTKPLEYTQA